MRVSTSRTGLRSLFILFLGLLLLGPGLPGRAETAQAGLQGPVSGGEVLLTVSGLGVADGDAAAPRTLEFDRAALEAIGSGFLQTATPWTDGRPVFRGVLARDLLAAVKAEGVMVRAIALNDYRYDIPLSDFRDYPVLIAYEMNGEPLSIRDKGPLWIVYPLDQFSELQNSTTRRKMVWQLEELQIR